MPRKSFKLRAFKIETGQISKKSSGIINLLTTVLTGSIVKDRCMPINNSDELLEEDLMPFYNIPNVNYIKGTMMRSIVKEGTPDIPNDFYQKDFFEISELDSTAKSSNICKNYFYFFMSDEYLIVTLPGNITIGAFQTYINWLLEKVRGTTIFTFTPIIRNQTEVEIKDIGEICVKDPFHEAKSDNHSEKGKDTGLKKFKLPGLDILLKLFPDADNDTLIILSKAISAELLVKFKKPDNMTKSDYKKAMGTYLKPISDVESVTFKTKKGQTITGASMLLVKPVDVEVTASKKPSDQDLFLKMEEFIKEIVLNEEKK